ncbi:MAG: GNAT family N-acetyltransferase [Aquincola tertiaricarbonis]|uniref:GNAT family N-acetyltransferase n=1 Tax=Aquincola tertiaricarbonis TaxID=391953 RepID=UPI0012ECCDCB|nr:GNAT family N-acetyltransferase [Aquincola tertiaricarbonis]
MQALAERPGASPTPDMPAPPAAAPGHGAHPAPCGLRLREFQPADRAALVAMHRDPRVRALLVDDMPLDDPRVAGLFIERMQAYYRRHEGLGIWCAEHWAPALSAAELADPQVRASLSDHALQQLSQPRPRFAGWFNLMRMADDPDRIEIGCRLLPAYWGSGLVHQGGELLLARAFEELRLPRLWAACHPAHRPVQHVLRTLGFVDDGERPCDGAPARWFVMPAQAWPAVRDTPRRLRLRQALR